MKASEEIRRWVNRRRRAQGKKNGVVSFLWDAPKREVQMAKNKRLVRRHPIERRPEID